MSVWFRTYNEAPSTDVFKVAGIPLDWPWDCREQEDEPADGDNWIEVADSAALTSYKNAVSQLYNNTRQQAYDTWYVHFVKSSTPAVLPADEEFRFKTHSFVHPSEWNGKTNGDPTAWFVGGNFWHDAVGMWFTGLPYPYGSGAPITAVYDDVHYKWYDANGTEKCYLDLSVNKWKRSDTEEVIVEFNHTTQHWERKDTGANVTSSRWSIIPYPHTHMIINKATMRGEIDVLIPGALHYKVYKYLTEDELAVAGFPGYPAGVYKVKDHIYASLAELRDGCDSEVIDPVVLPYNDSHMITLVYEYRDATVPAVLEACTHMRLDICLESHLPMTNTSTPTRATFTGIKRYTEC
jgi:hypothetical protein